MIAKLIPFIWKRAINQAAAKFIQARRAAEKRLSEHQSDNWLAVMAGSAALAVHRYKFRHLRLSWVPSATSTGQSPQVLIDSRAC
jgi:hypothetical protein